MSSKPTNLRNICTSNRIRSLGWLVSVGGVIAVCDSLITGPDQRLRAILTFLSGVGSIGLAVYLHRTSDLRLTTFGASVTTSLVFLGNFILYGDPYYMAIGFSIPIAASLFLSARDAVWVIGIYGCCGVLIAVLLQRGIVVPTYSSESLTVRTIIVIAIIVSMAGPTMLMQYLFEQSVEREYQLRGRFETICDYGFGAMLELDSTGRIVFARGRLINELGFEVEDLLGRRPMRYLAREDRRKVLKSAGSASSNRIEDELQIIDATGQERWVRISGGTSNVPGANSVYALQDIHEQHIHRQRVNEFSRLESLGNLSAGLAHDFNNLLTVIGISAAGIEDQSRRDEILRAQRQAADLTSGLLTFARRQPFRKQDICLVELLESFRPLLQQLLSASVTCRWNIDCDTAAVRLDPSQFEQVLVNLITNAKQAMPNGGTVSIELEEITLSESEAAEHKTQPGKFARVMISDSGCGMDAQTISRSIEPFFTTKARGVGTGLGLAMAHGTMLGCDGALSIKSQPGHGTEISLLVPLRTASAKHSSADSPTKETSDSPPSSYQIVLVEDHPIVAASIKEMLESLGHGVQLFYDAESAAAALAKNPNIDILVSDVVLPGMSGIDLVKQTIERHAKINSILISGYLTQELAVLTGPLGSVEILSKPFTADQLRNKMADVLRPTNVQPELNMLLNLG